MTTHNAIYPRGTTPPPLATAVLPLGAGGNQYRCPACIAVATWDGEEPVPADEWCPLPADTALRCECECHDGEGPKCGASYCAACNEIIPPGAVAPEDADGNPYHDAPGCWRPMDDDAAEQYRADGSDGRLAQSRLDTLRGGR